MQKRFDCTVHCSKGIFNMRTITRTNEKYYLFVRVILGLLKLPVQTGNISRLYGQFQMAQNYG
jgi:hypothetical protein